jgi:hypothetical protein
MKITASTVLIVVLTIVVCMVPVSVLLFNVGLCELGSTSLAYTCDNALSDVIVTIALYQYVAFLAPTILIARVVSGIAKKNLREISNNQAFYSGTLGTILLFINTSLRPVGLIIILAIVIFVSVIISSLVKS